MQKITSIDEITCSSEFEKTVTNLYGSAEGQTERYKNLYLAHVENFNLAEGEFFSSPGRIEVIGNHTDHNHGKVLTAAISVDTLAFVTKTDDNIVRINSEGYAPFEQSLDDLSFVESEAGNSKALVKGIAKYFVDNGCNVGGFTASVTSCVPAAAGVSSSASFELLIAEIFNVLYNDGAVSKMKKAQASQYAENVYFLKPCGLMDQSAISLGGVSMIDFENVENPFVLGVQYPFTDTDIVITNTGGNHADLTSDYAAIRAEMEEVSEKFSEKYLRLVDYQKFLDAIPALQNEVSGRAIMRAIHFFDENLRVDKAVSAINMKNADAFYKTVGESGDSSFKLLQNCYVPVDTVQRIPLGIVLSQHVTGVKAVRVHGGGFAGTIIAFVEKAETHEYVSRMSEVFGAEHVYKLSIRQEGACRVEF